MQMMMSHAVCISMFQDRKIIIKTMKTYMVKFAKVSSVLQCLLIQPTVSTFVKLKSSSLNGCLSAGRVMHTKKKTAGASFHV